MTQPDMAQILAQAQEMQAKLNAAQQEILDSTVTGTAGNGLVEVTMTGAGTVEDIKISKDVVDPEDVDTLQDLILGALKDGHNKASELAAEKMGPISQGMNNGPMGSLFG